MTIHKLLIANRGEIAVRIIRAARELGLATAQVYSKADRDSLAVRLADESIEIGPPQASRSYLDHDAILAAAETSGADAIHPGYGFLAENAVFAAAVEAAGLIFVGPTAQSIRLMGDKVAARKAAALAGVPTVPGSRERLEHTDAAFAFVETIGFPVMIKAAAGGGGRGIRIARSEEDFHHLIPQAQAEALAAFGDGGLYVEKFIEGARHIEVQVLGDGLDVIHCFERECSLQRRRQKLWEEAPSPSLTPAIREKLCASAVALARTVHYRGAGTIEYLYDDRSNAFYFLEMNTRIQVEHPVTEMVTGIDLVREMIRIAGGEPLRIRQDHVHVNGHSIEVRINAEDPAKAFGPSPGTVSALNVPGGNGVRFDTMLYSGCTVPPYYDSLIGKLIVLDEDRTSAMRRLDRALSELRIEGLATTKTLHQALARDPDVQVGRFHTSWLEPWLASHAGALAGAEPVPAPSVTPEIPRESAPSATGGSSPMQTRFSFGGDDHIFAEVDESMSLEAFFKSLFVTNAVRDARIKGVMEICPANASYQVKFDPDQIKPDDMLAELRRLDLAAEKSEPVIETRLIEIPVFYNDPWTRETLMRFRERHQDPEGTDLDYAARINHLDGIDAFVKAHSSAPWFVSMVGFVAGLPFLYQMVERKRQIQVPKYLRPRTDTPKLTVGHGGCFGCIYSVRGAGGYQMFGITPMPIYDPSQKISYLRDFMCLFKPGDIVKWRPIDRSAYDAAVADVEAGRFSPIVRNVSFSLTEFNRDIDGYNRKLEGILHAH